MGNGHCMLWYGVATMSRLLKILRLFCRISSVSWESFAKKTYNFKEPTNRSHPIRAVCTHVQKASFLKSQTSSRAKPMASRAKPNGSCTWSVKKTLCYRKRALYNRKRALSNRKRVGCNVTKASRDTLSALYARHVFSDAFGETCGCFHGWYI